MGAIVKLGNDWIIKVLISLHKFFQASWIESTNWLHKQHQNMQKQVRQTNTILKGSSGMVSVPLCLSLVV